MHTEEKTLFSMFIAVARYTGLCRGPFDNTGALWDVQLSPRWRRFVTQAAHRSTYCKDSCFSSFFTSDFGSAAASVCAAIYYSREIASKRHERPTFLRVS